jgi:RNA polymerase sigma factor (sigma-70 family)
VSAENPPTDGLPLPGPDPEECLRRWQEEDDLDALDALLRHEVQDLKARILLRGPGGLSASVGATDAANEAVVRLLKQDPGPRFENSAGLRAYLWSCARNLLVDRLRAKRGMPIRLDATNAASFADVLAASGEVAGVDDAELLAALDLAMNLLSEGDRQVLELHYMEGLQVKEIGERLDARSDAIKMRLVRARRRLAERMAGWREVVETLSS